jgi:hypothetical protein
MEEKLLWIILEENKDVFAPARWLRLAEPVMANVGLMIQASHS